MPSASQVAAARARTEAKMLDACTVYGHPEQVWDEATGKYTPTPNVVYSGKCELKAATVEAQNRTVEGVDVVVQQLTLKLPIAGSEGVRAGDTVTITASTFDEFIGRTYTIGAFVAGSFQTARRLPITEVQQP